MCYQGKNKRMSALHYDHLKLIKFWSPQTAEFTQSVFDACTKNLTPHLPILPMFTAMYESLLTNNWGVLGPGLIRVPLSIIPENKFRYRVPIISELHETILSFRMSQLTVKTLEEALKKHGLCLLFMCSCGVVLGTCEAVRNFYGSQAHRDMDKLRSAIDAAGYPVKEVDSWDDVPYPNMDISQGEREMFARMEQLLNNSSQAQPAEMAWIDASLELYIREANKVDLVC